MQRTPFLSVVAPVFNGEGHLEEWHKRLAAVLKSLGRSHEIIVVDDGSVDGTWDVITGLSAKDAALRGVQLSRNFGQHTAITAGLDASAGEWVVVMDSDLQDRPEEIPRLLDKALQGFRLVFARRMDRTDAASKKWTSRLFYKVLNGLADVEVDPATANFGIFNRLVVDNFCVMRERSRSFHTLVRTLGFRTGYVDVAHEERFAGETSYTFSKMLDLAVDIIVSQSTKPLRISIKLGFAISLGAFVYALFLIARKYLWALPVEGWTSVMVSLYFLVGLIMANLGILGLYIGKIFDESKGRPLYVVREKAGGEVAEAAAPAKPKKAAKKPAAKKPAAKKPVKKKAAAKKAAQASGKGTGGS